MASDKGEKKVQLGCFIPVELAARVRAAAAHEGATITQWVRDALEANLTPSRATPVVPMPLPVKRALEATNLAWW